MISLDQIFPTARVRKEGKRTFFSNKMHFFKIRKNGLIFTCNMSMKRSWNVGNGIFVHFQKSWKMTSIETKVWKWQKCQKNHILFLVSKKVIFHYFWKWRKILFSTFQDLSIDILHVKIKPFLRILKKMVKKVRFCSFLTHAVGKIWSKLIKCMCNSIFNHNLTLKTHIFQRYSL